MSIRCITPMYEINQYIDKQVERLHKAIIHQLAYAGSECVNVARAKHPNNWRDDTGNLRSSIGFVIVEDGKIVQMSNFENVLNGKQGHDEGIAYATKLAAKFNENIALVVVAGMDYAYYVSKTRDVLDSAELKAEQIIPQLLRQLNI